MPDKHLKTGLMETVHLLVNFPNVEKTKYTRQGGIFLCLKLIMQEMSAEMPLCANIDIITII